MLVCVWFCLSEERLAWTNLHQIIEGKLHIKTLSVLFNLEL